MQPQRTMRQHQTAPQRRRAHRPDPTTSQYAWTASKSSKSSTAADREKDRAPHEQTEILRADAGKVPRPKNNPSSRRSIRTRFSRSWRRRRAILRLTPHHHPERRRSPNRTHRPGRPGSRPRPDRHTPGTPTAHDQPPTATTCQTAPNPTCAPSDENPATPHRTRGTSRPHRSMVQN